MANNALSVSSLDFDTIRERLVSTLRADPKFKDWDFLGSNISVLLDLLSYNTFMNNFYVNMNLSESFLDSAQLRDSVVSKAKELNYTPRSMTSSKAVINVRLSPPDNPATVTVPKGTVFNSRIDNSVLSFITDTPTILRSSDNYSADISIYEGTYITETFTVDTSIEQRFVLSNENIDTKSLTVSVDGVEYTLATSLLGLKSTDNIYFCQATAKNKFEIIFGDSIYGSGLINGNIISTTYRVTSGPLGNGASVFTGSNISGYPTTISTVETSSGGSDRESISSIKYNAPRHYQTRERAVTKTDYEVLVTENFPEVRTVNIFGGEEIEPPKYGKVFVSVDIYQSEKTPSSLKNNISQFLKERNMVNVTPIVVDPERTYLIVNASVSYDQNKTVDQQQDIEAYVFEAIVQYDDAYMNDFGVTFMPSKMSTAIDNCHPSIISSTLEYRLMKKLEGLSVSLDFQNPLQVNSVSSTSFNLSGTEVRLSSASTPGTIDVISTSDSTILASNIGNITPEGKIVLDLSSLSITGIENCLVEVSPTYKEVSMKNNVIFNVYRPLISSSATPRRI